MKQTIRKSIAPNIIEGRALTLKVLKAQMTLGSNGHRISAVPRKSLSR
jgi:hypothetical protein